MKRILRNLVVGVSGILLLSSLSTKANSVTVEEVGIGANHVVSITSSTLNGGNPVNVYAGVVKLTVNGVPTDAFCIDPFHWSVSGPQPYESVPLDQAPKSPGGGMGTTEALLIEKLWALNYNPGMGNDAAAGLQIAIWNIIGAGAQTPASFTLNGYDYGASVMISLAQNSSVTPANLLGVTGGGQDYVIPNSGGGGSVPDGGTTILLLGGALCGLALIRRKLCTC